MDTGKPSYTLVIEKQFKQNLKQIVDYDTAIKLKAIEPTLIHSESEVAEIFGIARFLIPSSSIHYKLYPWFDLMN